MPVRVRYAPSPTGSPHVGNLRTAIYDWLLARKEGGQFLARLEDTDRSAERYNESGIADIEESLRFLGIVPDEWWVSGGPVGPYVQSERLPLYQKEAARLIESGHAYRCYCTKERLEEMRKQQDETMRAAQQLKAEIANRNKVFEAPDSSPCQKEEALKELGALEARLKQQGNVRLGYDRRCRTLSPDEIAQNKADGLSSVVRLKMPMEGVTVVHDIIKGDIPYDNRTQDDQVLMKSDGFPTYFLAAAVDDHAMGITHIIRGDDWLSSAAKLVRVFEALGYDVPQMAHPPLILGPDKKKLSKRHGATQFTDFIAQGYLPEALFNFLVLLGWSAGEENRELFTMAEMIERFSLEGISPNPAIFDYDKLKWMNGHYLRQSAPERIIALCVPYLIQAGMIASPPSSEEMEYVRRVVPLEIERMKILSEVAELVGFFFQDLKYPVGYDEKAVRKWFGMDHIRPLLEKEITVFDALPDWTAEALETATRGISEEFGIEFAKVIHPTRVAVTGRTVGPGLFETLWALGRERTLVRLKHVLAGI